MFTDLSLEGIRTPSEGMRKRIIVYVMVRVLEKKKLNCAIGLKLAPTSESFFGSMFYVFEKEVEKGGRM